MKNWKNLPNLFVITVLLFIPNLSFIWSSFCSKIWNVLKVWVCFKTLKYLKTGHARNEVKNHKNIIVIKGLMFKHLASNWYYHYFNKMLRPVFFYSTWIQSYELLKRLAFQIWNKLDTKCQLKAKSMFRTCCFWIKTVSNVLEHNKFNVICHQTESLSLKKSILLFKYY